MLTACASFPGRGPGYAPATAQQADTFAGLSGLVGKTWRSARAGDGEGGAADISKWSRDPGGRLLVNRPALGDGSCGGVTYVCENRQTGSLHYVCITSVGFHTTGSFGLGKDGSRTADEAVTGHNTVTRMRSAGRLTAGG